MAHTPHPAQPAALACAPQTPTQPGAHTLAPGACRTINASEGVRLVVQSGCLWLTRPNDAVDRFLVAGDTMELHERLVLLQSDKTTLQKAQAASYVLQALHTAQPAPPPHRSAHRMPQTLGRWARQAWRAVQGTPAKTSAV